MRWLRAKDTDCMAAFATDGCRASAPDIFRSDIHTQCAYGDCSRGNFLGSSVDLN